MTLFITYPELQQLVANKLNQNVELQFGGNDVLKLTLHTSIKKIVTVNVDSSAELKLSMYDDDLYIDYRVLPIENVKNEALLGIIDSLTPNAVNLVLNYLRHKYPQYNDIVEKVPNMDRLRVHLNAIPQLKNVLQYVEIDSIVPREEGMQIIARMKSN